MAPWPFANTGITPDVAERMAEAGVNVFFISYDSGWKDKASWRKSDDEVSNILAANPEAWIIARVRCTVTESWVDENPDELNTFEDGRTDHYENGNPDQYVLLGQSVKLQPGRLYELSAWIKTENLKGVRESGATVCLGYKDVTGKHINGGPHPGGQKGTRGWWQLVSYGYVPSNVVGGGFTCYVRKQEKNNKTFTGKAWWDDLCLRPVSLIVRMLTPDYKRIIFDDNDEIGLEVDVWPEDFGLNFDDVELVVKIVNKKTSKSVSTKSFALTRRQEKILFSVGNLAHDIYEVFPSLINKNNSTVLWQAYKYTIYRKSTSAKPMICFDEHYRCIVNDEPFFPVGVYVRAARRGGICEYKKTLKNLTDSGFNCFMNYDEMTNEQMDQAYEAGLKVIYSVKNCYNKIWYCPLSIRCVDDEVGILRKTVKRLKNHPALLAWYVNDELGPSELPQHLAHYEVLNELDHDHPAWSLHDKVYEEHLLVDTCDVIGTDMYPVPFRPVSEATEKTKGTIQATGNSRPVWMVPQIMNWSVWGKSGGRPPTLKEMRCMSWQAICEGANGLMFYSYHDLFKDKEHPFKSRWPGIKQMASEISKYIPILLSIEPFPEVKVDGPEWLGWTTKRLGNTLYIFTVNNGSGNSVGYVQFRVTGLDSEAKIKVVTFPDSEKIIYAKQGKWKDTFKKLDVKLYEIQIAK